MCLDHAVSRWKGLSRKVETGYKIFALFPSTNQLKFMVFSHKGYKRVETGKWLTSGGDLATDNYGKRYYAGFHIYKNKPDIGILAIYPERIVKVKYKGVLAKGLQVDHEVIVAHHMWVPRHRRNK